jgi:hypothetical protein
VLCLKDAEKQGFALAVPVGWGGTVSMNTVVSPRDYQRMARHSGVFGGSNRSSPAWQRHEIENPESTRVTLFRAVPHLQNGSATGKIQALGRSY